MADTLSDLKTALVADAAREGFALCRIARADLGARPGAQLEQWLGAGHHGGMGWMAERVSWRRNPVALWPAAECAIVVAHNYAPETDPRLSLAQRDRATLSIYAARRDYHDVLKGRLKRIAGRLVAAARRAGHGAEVKVFVDTAPLLEKPLAQAAGIGWQGKHTVVLSRELGNWLFLGAILTTLRLPVDEPGRDHCGRCRRCLDICPTDAFPAPYVLDARRCISYLTIEHDGPIPKALRRPMGNRVFGCDDCLAVCPWNKFAEASRDTKLALASALHSPPLSELLALDEPAFRRRFAGTPVKRTGHARFLRNVLIAAGNSGDAGLVPAIRLHLGAASPLVRGAAVWALWALLPSAMLGPVIAAAASDPDAAVRDEVADLLSPSGASLAAAGAT